MTKDQLIQEITKKCAEDFKILGREPTLADVLVSLKNLKLYYGIMDDGKFIHLSPRANSNAQYVIVDTHWNLKSGLHNQELETLQFIHDLLYTK